MEIASTPIYAAAIAALMAVLSTITAVTRGTTGVALGDGGTPKMALAIRRFGNLSEYAAMAVFMLLLLEISGVPAQWLHAYGLAFVAVRLLHPFILFDTLEAPGWMKFGRFISGAGTAALLLTAAITVAIRMT